MNHELTKDFINAHLNDDVNKLALSKFPDDIDKQFVIRQIQARQLLKKKLPSWSENDELLFPKRLSLEQCSSELTALYKRTISRKDAKTQSRDASMAPAIKHIDTSLHRILVDLTGGMGVDTSFLSDNFDETIYVESQAELCELAEHNFKVLKKNIKVVNAKAEDFLTQCEEVDCIYLDPARRDEYGRKMVSLHDCSPDVAELQDLLFEKTNTVIVKLSPMLDIDIIKKELNNIKEIHVVAVKNECKEVLVLCQRTTDNGQQTSSKACSQLITIDLRENWSFTFSEDEEQEAVPTFADEIGKYLYEPGVACMKAAPFKLLSQRFNIKKLHRNSHLYTSDELVTDFPGRTFEVINVVPFDKKARKILSQQTTDNGQQSLSKVSIAVRNFPLSAEELRKHLSFKDGDDFYIFGTTMKGEKKVLILGSKC
ncbi:MAG: SAM-dependent methyltransferase [Bacteroidales bacterium]|nr:SAM-dependent methyltransferase [Bacteroidales bacterium]